MTKYVLLVKLLQKVNVPKCWTGREIEMLTEMISDLMDRGCETFANYKLSEIATQKWHALIGSPSRLNRKE